MSWWWWGGVAIVCIGVFFRGGALARVFEGGGGYLPACQSPGVVLQPRSAGLLAAGPPTRLCPQSWAKAALQLQPPPLAQPSPHTRACCPEVSGVVCGRAKVLGEAAVELQKGAALRGQGDHHAGVAAVAGGGEVWVLELPGLQGVLFWEGGVEWVGAGWGTGAALGLERQESSGSSSSAGWRWGGGTVWMVRAILAAGALAAWPAGGLSAGGPPPPSCIGPATHHLAAARLVLALLHRLVALQASRRRHQQRSQQQQQAAARRRARHHHHHRHRASCRASGPRAPCCGASRVVRRLLASFERQRGATAPGTKWPNNPARRAGAQSGAPAIPGAHFTSKSPIGRLCAPDGGVDAPDCVPAAHRTASSASSKHHAALRRTNA